MDATLIHDNAHLRFAGVTTASVEPDGVGGSLLVLRDSLGRILAGPELPRVSLAVVPAAGWPCDTCRTDYKAQAPIWREVEQSFYETMRDCVPPEALGQGLPGFMVGEPFDHLPSGEAVHLTLVHARLDGQNRYFARHLPRRSLRAPVEQLLNHLRR
jgi:hypothetical protein